MSRSITNAELRAATGISASYASMILNGKRECPPALALKIYRATGHRLGSLAEASDEEIEIFARLAGVVHAGDANCTDTDVSPDKDGDFIAAGSAAA